MSTLAIPQTPTTTWIINPAQATKPPALYQEFDGQYIDGSWRPGKHGGVQVDTDPYSGATLAETVMANQGDLDEAYHAAAKAQVSWAAQLPAERAARARLHRKTGTKSRPAFMT